MYSAARSRLSARSMATAFRSLSLHEGSTILPATTAVCLPNYNHPVASCRRPMSTGKKNFKPQRRPDDNYRPVKPRGDKRKSAKGNKGKGFPQGDKRFKRSFGDEIVELGDGTKPATGFIPELEGDELASALGPVAAEAIRHHWKEKELLQGKGMSVEEKLRVIDYLTSPEGSLEDLVGERRALAFDSFTKEEQQAFLTKLDKIIDSERASNMGINPHEVDGPPTEDELYRPLDMSDPDVAIDPNQQAYGEWGELLIRVDRVNSLWRGGRLESYRALVIGGNLNGCGGFGVGKGFDARDAVASASRMCKRNIFFVKRHQNNGLTRSLTGKENSCRVIIQATDRGLRGNPLMMEILKYFGIANATAKCVHGRRTQTNVVRATFKALATHESIEEIALKRGKRLVSLSQGRRLGV